MVMNINDFAVDMVDEWVDYDGRYGHQCVDLFREFCKKVLGTTVKPRGNAKDLFYKDFGKDWKKIKNDMKNSKQVPIPGDIIIWGGGKYGHIAVVLEAHKGENKIKVLEQNVGEGKGDGIKWNGKGEDDYVKINVRSYKNVLGWYRFNKDLIENPNYKDAYEGCLFVRKKAESTVQRLIGEQVELEQKIRVLEFENQKLKRQTLGVRKYIKKFMFKKK